MKKKMVFAVLFLCISFVFAGEFSAELSIGGGPEKARTDHHFYSDVFIPTEFTDHSTINLKIAASCFYKNSGIYISSDKLFGDDLFNRYFVFSGGFKQKVLLGDKLGFDMYVGTTWHSVDAAIQSVYEIFLSTKVYSRPGVDVGVDLNYVLSDKISVFVGFNYNYNKQVVTCPPNGLENVDDFYFQMMSFNAGISYRLF
jgi:hypothetical protein